MQIQKKQKASILIWVFFLTLLMSFSFIFIQFQIQNSLKVNSKRLENLEEEKKIQEFLWDINAQSIQIWENTLEVESFSSLEYSLKKDEILWLNFTETWTINIELLNSWIVSYATWAVASTLEFWTNILPTYNTGATSVNVLVNTWEKLEVKAFSWNPKLSFWASKKIIYPLDILPSAITFKKSWKITMSIWVRWWGIKYKINSWIEKTLTWNSTENYTSKSFFVKVWDSLSIINFDNPGNNKKLIISWDYNISDLIQNNSYKISKKTWWKEVILEEWKIR